MNNMYADYFISLCAASDEHWIILSFEKGLLAHMELKNNRYIRIYRMLKYVSLLLSIMAIFTLWGCGYQNNPVIPDRSTPEASDDQDPEEPSGEENNNINGTDNNDLAEKEEDLNPYDFTLTFAGDINFDENWSTMKYYNTVDNGIHDCISPELIQIMRDADIMCLNNEFTYSTGGSPMENKAYTFRAHPSRVDILRELGVDIVSLANNHVYDYGKQSLIDTMTTLKESEIHYMGAGHNLDEAMTPVYLEIQGKTISYVAASRAEKYKMTPQATEDSAGILRCYDTELFIETINKAKENSDYVIASVHWGTEYSYELEEVQLTTGREYLDAGADIVVGAHPHCLQAIEYYDEKPIIYSLGNFWFNDKTIDTILLNINFHGNDIEEFIELEIIPAIQTNNKTIIAHEQSERKRIFSFLEDISINVEIDEAGIVSEVD